jgi:hypothetical protein
MMATLMVHEVIGQAEKAKSKKDKIEILKKNESWALKDILRGTYDSKVKWILPKGMPPYTPNDGEHNAPSNLLKRNVDFRYFVEGGAGAKLPSYKRESIFVGLIEAVAPEDALLVISMINKEPLKGLPRKVVEEAFPGLLQDNP